MREGSTFMDFLLLLFLAITMLMKISVTCLNVSRYDRILDCVESSVLDSSVVVLIASILTSQSLVVDLLNLRTSTREATLMLHFLAFSEQLCKFQSTATIKGRVVSQIFIKLS